MRLIALAATLFAALSLFAAPAAAQGYQPPDLAAQRAAMQRLAPLIGHWQGEANVAYPERMLVHQTELVEADLDGLVLLVRGTGHGAAARTGAPIFEALAVISYDSSRRQYEFRAYNNGYASTATGEFLEDGAFRWCLNAGGPMRMRFTIRFDQQSWREVGEVSRDGGANWTQTIVMDLRRVP